MDAGSDARRLERVLVWRLPAVERGGFRHGDGHHPVRHAGPRPRPCPSARRSTPPRSRWATWADRRASTCSCCRSTTARTTGTCRRRSSWPAPWPARPQRIPINISALLVPLHDPIRLAEDIAVLDLLSGGRISIVAGLGYRPVEYAMFDSEWKRRGKRMDECLEVMIKAWTGEPFEYGGETVQVTPRPVQQPHPMIMVGGSGEAGGQAGGPVRPRLLPATRRRASRRGLPPGVRAAGHEARLRARAPSESSRARCSWPRTPTGCGARSGPTCCTTP